MPHNPLTQDSFATSLNTLTKTRLSVDEYFLNLATLASQRGTCIRRKVGCILVNARNHVLATGYSGVASGARHCVDFPCEGANLSSGTGLENCEAIHAEANSLLQCRDVYEIATVYCTHSPCIHCAKLLLNTSAQRIVFLFEYPHPKSRIMWEDAGRRWEHYYVR